MTKKEKITEPTNKPQGVRIDGIFGVFLLFVCISVGYANFVVWFGTSDPVSKVMLIPSTLFIALFLLVKATK